MMRAHESNRPALCALAALSLLLACDARPLVTIGVGPIPEGAAQLRASLTYGGLNSIEPSVYEFNLRQHPAGSTATFAARMPLNTRDELVVGVGVLDERDQQYCLLGIGAGGVEDIVETPRLDILLTPPGADIPPAELCNDPEKTPIMAQVVPALGPTNGALDRNIIIRGWGFQADPCPQVIIGGKSAENVTCASLVEIAAQLPENLKRIGKVPITVINKNQRRSTRGDLFSYYASKLIFTGMNYATGGQPSALAIGRIDPDAVPDLAVSNAKDGTVTVRISDGQGGFADPATTIAVGARPMGLAIADLNKDGKADLAVANSGDNTISVLEQVAQKPMEHVSFARTSAFANLAPTALSIVDLRKDRAPELIVAHRVSNDVSVLQGSVATRYARSAEYAVGREPSQLAAADLNGDGALDLAVLGSGSASILLYDQEQGKHKDAVEITLGAGFAGLALGDVDADGDVDLVAAGDVVKLLLNDGAGQFTQVLAVASDVIGPFGAVALGDLDLDGKLDLVLAALTQSRVYVLRNTALDGKLGFGPPLGVSVGMRPTAIALADFDGDGLLDLATANQGDGTVSIRLNRSE